MQKSFDRPMIPTPADYKASILKILATASEPAECIHLASRIGFYGNVLDFHSCIMQPMIDKGYVEGRYEGPKTRYALTENGMGFYKKWLAPKFADGQSRSIK
ncbi:MAG: hypothetical protein HY366_00025 [Candidatus Aenigmarchaeota archaeon]|nr:hypothetical protein [Candidatus Aenigmarchaeota archaeon]